MWGVARWKAADGKEEMSWWIRWRLVDVVALGGCVQTYHSRVMNSVQCQPFVNSHDLGMIMLDVFQDHGPAC